MTFEEYAGFAEELARRAGKMMRENFSHEVYADWKADGTPLTETDTAINRMVIETINTQFPDHAVMGEEEDWENDSEMVWSCDPIDGTIPYSHGLQMSTFSLALVQDGEPVVGVVFDPFHEEMFVAWKDGGSFMNGRKLAVSNKSTLKGTGVECDGLYGDRDIDEVMTGLKREGALVVSLLSFIMGAKQVATGHFSGAVFGPDKPYDCAALKVIIEEAGEKRVILTEENSVMISQLVGLWGVMGWSMQSC